jgi:bacterioferritin-associated ferredoxin
LGKNKKSTIVCRCWDVTLEGVEAAIDQGITDPEELKRVLQVGMGPCQGRTCGKIVNRILIEKTGKPASAVGETKHRPPLVSIPIREILGMKDG